jgi:hypothetical protein
MESKIDQPLQQLNNAVEQMPALWAACRDDPANLNHLYTLLGNVIVSLVSINDQLSSTITK